MNDEQGDELDSTIKKRIFEKVRKRLSEVQLNVSSELNPDVIVIRADQTSLFEPQNLRASKWLHQRCGSDGEAVQRRERIRVHPCECWKIINDLEAAGFEVAS